MFARIGSSGYSCSRIASRYSHYGSLSSVPWTSPNQSRCYLAKSAEKLLHVIDTRGDEIPKLSGGGGELVDGVDPSHEFCDFNKQFVFWRFFRFVSKLLLYLHFSTLVFFCTS